jgi:hypothetical protein
MRNGGDVCVCVYLRGACMKGADRLISTPRHEHRRPRPATASFALALTCFSLRKDLVHGRRALQQADPCTSSLFHQLAGDDVDAVLRCMSCRCRDDLKLESHHQHTSRKQNEKESG